MEGVLSYRGPKAPLAEAQAVARVVAASWAAVPLEEVLEGVGVPGGIPWVLGAVRMEAGGCWAEVPLAGGAHQGVAGQEGVEVALRKRRERRLIMLQHSQPLAACLSC